jgi:hypothetical protein
MNALQAANDYLDGSCGSVHVDLPVDISRSNRD